MMKQVLRLVWHTEMLIQCFVDPLGTYSWSEFWEDTKRVVNVIKNNVSVEAGICIGMSFEDNIKVLVLDLATRSDIIGFQYKNGELKFGHPNKSSFAAGLSLGKISILFGPRNEGFESSDYSEREYEKLEKFDISVSLGKGFAFVLGAHFNISFSISGFFDDIREEFSSDTEKQN